MAKAGELMDADTEFEYARGGKVWDKLNKQAIENHGEFGFATLDYDDMGKYINMKKANKLADKEFAEFGFDTLSESEMEELVNKYPEILKKYSRGYEEGEVGGNYDGGYDVVVYNRDGSQDVLEGRLSYSEAMKLLKSVKQYKNQYEEIAIIATDQSQDFEGDTIRYMKYFQKGGELMDADTEFEYKRGGNIDKTDPEYIEYSRLSEKLSAGTITPKEKERLFILAFGEDYMKSKNKGKKRKYDESGKRVRDRDRDEYARGGKTNKFSYIAIQTPDYMHAYFFKDKEQAVKLANSGELEDELGDSDFVFGETIYSDEHTIVSGNKQYNEGVLVYVTGDVPFEEGFEIEDISKKDAIKKVYELKEDDERAVGAYYSKINTKDSDSSDWYVDIRGNEFSNSKDDFEFEIGSDYEDDIISYNDGRDVALMAKGGELMDADTEFEYNRGGDVNDDLEQLEEASDMVNTAANLVDDVVPPNLKSNYQAYGRYGFDQLLGRGNPYDKGLDDIGQAIEESYNYEEGEEYAKGGEIPSKIKKEFDEKIKNKKFAQAYLGEIEDEDDYEWSYKSGLNDYFEEWKNDNETFKIHNELRRLKAKGWRNVTLNGFDESILYVIDKKYNDYEIKKNEDGNYSTTFAKGGDIDRDYKMINVGRSSVFTSGFKIYPEALKVGKIYEWTTGAQPLYVRYLGLTKDLNIRSSSSVGSDKYKFQFVGPGENNRYIGLSGTAVRQGNVVQVKNIEELIKEETLSEIKDYEKFIRKAKRAKDNNQIDRLTKQLNEYKSFYKSIDKLNQYAKGGDVKDKKFTFNKVEDKERFYEGGNISQVSKVGDPDYPTYEL